jgi:uncharacterized protein (DUF58 family)
VSFIGIIAALMLLAVVIGTIVDAIRQPYSTMATVGWIVLVLVLPFVGAIIYWIVRKPELPDAEAQYRLEAEQRHAAAHRPMDGPGLGP